jgi:sedoheptulokinase
MHGLLLWQQRKSWRRGIDQTRQVEIDHTSNLYTWQDKRCSQEFLASLPKPDSTLRVATGNLTQYKTCKIGTPLVRTTPVSL